MRRTIVYAVVTVASFAILASAALAGGSRLITKSSIGGGKPGQTRSQYRAAYGSPKPIENLENNFTRLRYAGGVEVYFKTGTKKGLYIVVTGKRFKTAKGVGPCAKASAVKAAYPGVVKVPLGGPEYAYRLGKKLWFEIEFGKVAAVALGSGKMTAWIASNSPSCGT